MASTGERVLVTGAAGFIGSHVSEALAARGDTVVGVDNMDSFYGRELKERNLAEVRSSCGGAFSFVEGDIRDAELMGKVMRDEGVTGVVHLAARAGVRPSIEDPVLYSSVNVVGTSVLLEASRLAGVGRFVCASSSSVYGNNERVPFSESDPVEKPISPYAATKRSCELIGSAHHHLTGTPVAMLRFFTVFGPRQRPDLAIAKFIRLIGAGETIPMFGDGTTSRDYTFIDDIVAGVLASYDRVPDFGYRIWNLGGSRPVELREMIATVGRVLGVEPRIDRRPMQAGDVQRTYAGVDRSKEELGYEAVTGFEEGVRKQAAWWGEAKGAGGAAGV